MSSLDGEEVRSHAEGLAGRLRLNRPGALHSLTRGMVRAMSRALLAWREDPDVHIILIDHASGRGFCAGGDVISIASNVELQPAVASGFFFDEYRLNHLMYTYPKPGVVFMDGVTMGGGVGIACPCRYRVATERTLFAMPETAIGIFPDVGGGRYLARLRGRLAQYLALTGARLSGADCRALRLATHYLPSDRIEEAKQRIMAQPFRVEAILDELADPDPPPAPVMSRIGQIDRCFASDRLEDILAALDAEAQSGDEWCAEQAATIRRHSPTACKVSLKLLTESPHQPHFLDEMRLEFGIIARLIHHPDFREGVRARLIDKDNAPRWNPARPEDVSEAAVAAYLEPLPPEEAWTPFPAKSREAMPHGL